MTLDELDAVAGDVLPSLRQRETTRDPRSVHLDD